MATPSASEKLLTADEFIELEDDPEGRAMELDDGRVVYLPPPGVPHGRYAKRIFKALDSFVSTSDFGEVSFEVGFQLRRRPDRVVAPDVAWVRPEALRKAGSIEGYFPGAPTLSVEVVSPTDRESKVARKILEYLDAGSERVWVVRPETRTVTVHRTNGDSHTYRMGDTLTSEDAALPEGFGLTLEAIFATD